MTLWSRLRDLFAASVIVNPETRECRPLQVRYSSPEMREPIRAKLRMASKMTQKLTGPTAAERARTRIAEKPTAHVDDATLTPRPRLVSRFPQRGER